MLRGGIVIGIPATPVGQRRGGCGSAILIQPRCNADTKQHSLGGLESIQVRLSQPNAYAFRLATLHRTVGVEKPTQKAAIEAGRSLLDARRYGLVARLHADFQRQVPYRTQAHSIFVASGYFPPSLEIRAMWKRLRRNQGFGHDCFDTAACRTAVGNSSRLPCRQHCLVLLEGAIPHQKSKQISLLARIPPGPLGVFAMVVEYHAIARNQFARFTPFRFGGVTSELADASNTVVFGQPQLVAFGGCQSKYALGRGAEKPLD